MRAIERTSRFKRDYRREKSGGLSKRLDQLLIEAIDLLAAERPLPQRYFDHPLSGEWSGFRDCHIRPDLVLIYEKPDVHTLRLVRLGSHSELGFLEAGRCIMADDDHQKITETVLKLAREQPAAGA